MVSPNPYTPPNVVENKSPEFSHEDGVIVSPLALKLLSKTRTWLQTICFIFFLASATMFIFLLAQFGMKGNINVGMFIVTLLITGVYFYIALKLNKYKKSISKLMITNDPVDFEKSMAINLAFWDLMAVLSIVAVITVLIFILK